MDKEPKLSDNQSKIKEIFKRGLQAGAFLATIGFSPNIIEGQNTSEAQTLRAENEQTIIQQIENKKLGIVGTMGSVPIRRWEEDGKILTVGYDTEGKAVWLMISQGDSLVFVDRDLDGNSDRIVIDNEHKGRTGLAFNTLDAFGDINNIATAASTRASLLPENKIVIDISGTVAKFVSLKTGEASQDSLEDDSVKSVIDHFQARFGDGLLDIKKIITIAGSKK